MKIEEERKMRRIASSIILASLFLSLFTFAFVLQTARAQSEGTIIINPNGSITPLTANITTSDNVTYTFTRDNYLPIVVNRSNIIINGMGHTLQAPWETGFSLTSVSNVTIKNTTITNSEYGIYLISSSGNVLSGNDITANINDGIFLGYYSDNNTLSGNNVTANINDGIDLWNSSGNVLSGNNVIANSVDGIWLDSSSGNTLSGNNVTANSYNGILGSSSDNNTLSGNNITANSDYGIYLLTCSYNVLFGNNVTGNSVDGVCLSSSSDNTFFHNDFINNTHQVSSDGSPNTWDNGYPSGGNYWSDYRTLYPNAAENDSSAIWNESYVIDANIIDHYPLMAPFSTFNAGTWNNTSYSVGTVSNSTISNFSFNGTAKTLTFDVSGPSGTLGFCRVIIPKSLMWCNSSAYWTVKINGVPITNLTITNDTSYTYIYFTYHHSTETVQITSTIAIPEFQPFVLLPLLMIVTLLTAIASKRKRKVAHVTKPAKELGLLWLWATSH